VPPPVVVTLYQCASGHCFQTLHPHPPHPAPTPSTQFYVSLFVGMRSSTSATTFGANNYGALRLQAFSKKMIIDRIRQRMHGITGPSVAVHSADGYVEIEKHQAGRRTGGGRCLTRPRTAGRVGRGKRRRLLGVGADAVIQDFVTLIACDYVSGRER